MSVSSASASASPSLLIQDLLTRSVQAEKNNQLQQAADLLDEAVALSAQHSLSIPKGANLRMGLLCYHLKDFGKAEGALRAGLEKDPKNFDMLNLLGVILRHLARPKEAIEILDRAIKINGKVLAPLSNKGSILLDMREAEAAIDVYTQLTRREPKNPEFQRLLGLAFIYNREFDKARPRLEMACRMAPKNPDAWCDRAFLASDLELHDEAISIMDQALQILPQDRKLLEKKIMVMRRARLIDKIDAFLTDFLAHHPDEAWAHNELARTISPFDRERGNVHFARCVELDPRNQTYRLDYAESLNRSRYGNEAMHIQAAYEQVLEAEKIKPIPIITSRTARDLYVRVGRYDLTEQYGNYKDYGRFWANTGMHHGLHNHIARVKNPEDRHEILYQHRLWGDICLAKINKNPIASPALVKGRKKYRLGIMSSDLRDHPVSYFTFPLFEFMDKERFEVYCYSFSRKETDRVEEYIKSRADVFRLHPVITDRDAALMIAKDELDMLFELGSSTDMNKLEVMGYKPAPIQASWLGYPHSAGLSTIDYILVDPLLNPPDPALLIEKPFIMPKTWVTLGDKLGFNERVPVIPQTPEDRKGYITFGTANNPFKYNQAMIDTWAQVVAQVENSRFLFVRPEGNTPAFRDNMIAHFGRHGVSADRVEFIAIRGQHLQYYNEIDISLDTFPQTGGTTTCESLWMGVPLITLVGEAFFERLSYTNLNNCGLGDFCAFSHAEFIQKAVKLAADKELRRALRPTMRQRIRQHPLGQHREFAADFYNTVAKTIEGHR